MLVLKRPFRFFTHMSDHSIFFITVSFRSSPAVTTQPDILVKTDSGWLHSLCLTNISTAKHNSHNSFEFYNQVLRLSCSVVIDQISPLSFPITVLLHICIMLLSLEWPNLSCNCATFHYVTHYVRTPSSSKKLHHFSAFFNSISYLHNKYIHWIVRRINSIFLLRFYFHVLINF